MTKPNTRRILLFSFWGALIAVWAALHFLKLYPTEFMGLDGGCYIRRITGFSCWSCGLTRMFDQLIQFRFLEAFRYNPLFFCLLSVFLALLTVATVRSCRKHPRPLRLRFRLWQPILLAALFLAFVLIRNTSWYLQFFYI